MSLAFSFISMVVLSLIAMQASAFVLFPDVHTACRAASVMRDETSVDAVEIFDRPALK